MRERQVVMSFFKNVFHSDGSMGMEYTTGNMRFDATKPGNPTMIIGDNTSQGGMRTVMRPNGTVAQEWEVGSMRFSSDKNGFDSLF